MTTATEIVETAETQALPPDVNDRQTAPAILAIDATGAVTRANLAAQRALGVTGGWEGTALGALIARSLTGGRDRISLSLQADGREVQLLLSENSHASNEAVAGPAVLRPTSLLSEAVVGELPNSLAIILRLARLALTNLESTATGTTAALQAIEAEAEDALLILNSLRLIAAVRQQPATPPASVPLHALIGSIVVGHRRSHPARTLTVTGEAPSYVRAHSAALKVALTNLIAHAEKVTPAAKPICVRLSTSASRATVLILDGGRLTRATNTGAFGMGLALAKDIVEATGGRLWTGPAPGGGNVSAVILPVAA
jgi:signal transduction histidine kinase